MNRRSLLACAPMAWLPLAPQDAGEDPAPALSMLVFVRHAEAAADTRVERDPLLSKPGELRAAALARLLSAAPVTHVFSSEFQRTRLTLAPLARLHELEPESLGAADLDAWQERLLGLAPGSLAVVAGHSNTVPALCHALGGRFGGDEPPAIAHADYDKAFLVGGPSAAGAARLSLELRYGA